ncbi:Membrane protein involved in the export of O-antigen and teichoic acid [Sphingopyxis sp. YR583]|uniref:lipopolysaccharide biosynthesis protein n=1 Tax=Sphingopyxis sp. YR583 TaxID=1881047 RepID=UPI0008A7F680|nr:lipopolysaccharide biosynthesis protein [Sphingopyxis sp. YR583]SEH11965.1 Membrane protein involved in the export of O-antigen and teichoic acid [Sphingopyxis sp. YR583]
MSGRALPPETTLGPDAPISPDFGQQVRRAVIWRSGSQIAGQIVAWASTFLVIRILTPEDYGLFALTQVMLMLFTLLNGYGLASAAIQRDAISRHELRQIFGLMLLLNGGLAVAQILCAPLAAAYYRQPMVADLLRVQSLIYLTIPFSALAYAQLARSMEFQRQAQVNLVSALIGAGVALGGALAGWGVWALVWAPISMFASRALGLTIAARSWMWPSFDFRGAGSIARYGGLMAVGQLFAFVQSQADILVAGRWFEAHLVGIYTTALLLTQIFNNKVVPPLNEVAFAAYARMQNDRPALAAGFTRSTRAIMVAAMPFFFGLAAVAEPLVLTLLGEKWREIVPLLLPLALAMPFWTLFTLLRPATDALGRPGIASGNAVAGALLMPVVFLVGAQWGIIGIAWAWLVAYPLLLVFAAARSLPVIGIRAADLLRAVAPPVLAAAAMAASVMLVDRLLPEMPEPIRLAILVAAGGPVYCLWLALFARETVRDLIGMVRGRRMPADPEAAV